MNIGKQIIEEIAKQRLVEIVHGSASGFYEVSWKENAADQIAIIVMNAAGKRIEELEAALDKTACCSNGHYNPLMKCDCYKIAHSALDNAS
jgi:hypothetical protein